MSVRGNAVICGVLMGLLAPAASLAGQVTLSFHAITNNASESVDIGEAQMRVIVTDVLDGSTLANQVVFVFQNIGPEASTIAQIYFEDGTLLGLSALRDKDDAINSIFGDNGVDFTKGSATPPKLPGGNSLTPKFYTTAGFLADADNPQPTNGINPGESLTVLFDLQSGLDFDDVITALNNTAGFGDKDNTSLRIGIHVQAFDNGESESFVNNLPPSPVPEPSSLILLSMGAVGMLGVTRRRKSKKPTAA